MNIKKYARAVFGLGILFFAVVSNAAGYRIINGWDGKIMIWVNKATQRAATVDDILDTNDYNDYRAGDAPESLHVATTITFSPTRSVSVADALKKAQDSRIKTPANKNKRPVYKILADGMGWKVELGGWVD